MTTVGLIVAAVSMKWQCLFWLSRWRRRWRVDSMPRVVTLVSAASVERQLRTLTPWWRGWHRRNFVRLVAVMIMAPAGERKRFWWLPWLWARRRVKLVRPVVTLMCCRMFFSFWPPSMYHNNISRNHMPEVIVMVQMRISAVYQFHRVFMQAEVAGRLIFQVTQLLWHGHCHSSPAVTLDRRLFSITLPPVCHGSRQHTNNPKLN